VLEDPLIDRVLATGVVNREELQDEVIDELVFSPDGRMLAVGTGMQLFYLWEWETGEQHPLFTGYDSHGIVFLNSRTLYYSYSAESTGIVECTNFSQPSPMQIQQEALAGRWNAEPMGTPASLYWLEFTEDSAFRYDGSSTIDTYAYFWWENFLITVRPNGISAAEVLRLESNRFELGAIYEPDILDRMP
jgi:hypothetical protein